MKKQYDVIIIGGGHNGLVCAAYLAKAGLSVLIIERRHETGGGLTTEDFAGARFNLHATYHLMSDIMPPYSDFNLRQEGVVYITPPVQAANLSPDAKAILLYNNLDKTVAELKNISSSDAEKYKKMYLEFKELCDEIIIPATYTLPVPPIEQMMILQKNKLGTRLGELSELSPREIINSYKFDNPNLRALLLFLSTMWGISPDVGGLGYLVPLYIYRMTNAALVKGGSHRLSSALCKVILKNKGDILDGCEVKKIILSSNKVQGIVTDDDKEYYAKIVVSTVNPHQTFLNFIGAESLSKEISHSAKNWKWENRTFFGLHIALKEKLKFKQTLSAYNPDIENALVCVVGYDTEEKIISHIKEIEQGILPEEICGHITSTTLFDKSQAPDGVHILRWESFAPYTLKTQNAPHKSIVGSWQSSNHQIIKSPNHQSAIHNSQSPEQTINWDDIKYNYAAQCIEKLKEYTNVSKPIRIYPYSPLDIERKITSMREGSIKHGEYNPLQMGYFRPNDFCSSIKTPVEGLYVSGASVYPGGMIVAGSGYNAANVVCKDLGVEKWWKKPEYIIKAEKKGLIPCFP